MKLRNFPAGADTLNPEGFMNRHYIFAVGVGIMLNAVVIFGLTAPSPLDQKAFIQNGVGCIWCGKIAQKRQRSRWFALWGFCGLLGVLGVWLFLKDRSPKAVAPTDEQSVAPSK